MTTGSDHADNRHQPSSHGAGLLRGTLVRTLDGVLPVEFLEPGDRIITRSGARRLGSVSVTHRRALAVVRIAASSQGHDWPEQDLLLPSGQATVVRDWRARAIFQAPVAVVPVERLVDGQFVRAETLADATIFTLHFPEDEVIWAEGLEIVCPALQTETATAQTA